LEPDDIDEEDCGDSDEELCDVLDSLDDERELEGGTCDEDDDSGGTPDVLDEEGLSEDVELLDNEEETADAELSLDAEVCEDELLPDVLDDGVIPELLESLPADLEDGVELEPEVCELCEVLDPEDKLLRLESDEELTDVLDAEVCELCDVLEPEGRLLTLESEDELIDSIEDALE